MKIELLISVITALGIGSILGAYFQSRFQYKKELKNEENDIKRKRFGAIIIQMLTIIDFNKNIKYVQKFRPDLINLDDYINETKAELLNSISYASDNVISSISDFLRKKDYKSYLKAVISIRKDLWGKKTKINEETFINLI